MMAARDARAALAASCVRGMPKCVQKKGTVGSESGPLVPRKAGVQHVRQSAGACAWQNWPSARWVHDQRPLPAIILCCWRRSPPPLRRRQESDQLLVNFERLPHIVGLTGRLPWRRKLTRPGRQEIVRLPTTVFGGWPVPMRREIPL